MTMLVPFEKNNSPIGQKFADWSILKRIAKLVARMAQLGVHAQLGSPVHLEQSSLTNQRISGQLGYNFSQMGRA